MLPDGYKITGNSDTNSVRKFILHCPNNKIKKWKSIDAAEMFAQTDNIRRQSLKIKKVLRYFKKRFERFDYSEHISKTTFSTYFTLSYMMHGSLKFFDIRLSDHNSKRRISLNYIDEDVNICELKSAIKKWIKS